ncbi:hypothetical protein N4G70_26540 [Streptomyces sp. ASQP_92]|uniref:hypothetical protein n=1 Tax=Streptomyces sp. ASQP_92 TaxID=2979116 RepID=UPI0021BE92E7|nr:hypothetical protein [Streptomyces sp. ASQP_92]MCT9092400.1 hypothetical protein [Streptomyces sp. ASQP_92]
MGLPAAPAYSAAPAPRIDLKVLVVSDGGPATDAITAELDGEGTPYTEVDLTKSGRPVIDQAFLADTVNGVPRAKFQAVVLPNDNPFPAGSAEMAALAAYEKTYAIPQVDAYTYARPQVGLQPAATSGYSGPVDGLKAQVTAAGRGTGPFGYLNGSVPFEDNSPAVSESYAFLSQPAAGADFTSYVEAPLPGRTGNGTLVGEYRHDGRRELVVTFAYNRHQEQFKLLARGIVDWMTQNVRLGASRNYFAVHVDDVFAGDDRWDATLNCTPGDVDCPPGQGVQDSIRMTPADVAGAVAWEKARGFTLDLAYNGGGSVEYRENHGGADQLADALTATRNDFRWVNHTYDHAYLGCEQNVTVVPWKCATNPDGSTKYVSQTEISREISANDQWAKGVGLPVSSDELITGEHSGMRLLPQQPQDNPYLAPALTANNIGWLGADMSRDPQQRPVGGALTVARYPINIFYNAGHVAEQVDEYNWIYTSRTQGGSGLCDDLPNTTCLPGPLDAATGYTGHIVPLETRVALGHVLGNDPRPHFIHQSNLAEDHIGYPVLDGVLDQYRTLYAPSAPLINPRMKDIGAELRDRDAWSAAVKAGQVTAYRIGDSVTVQAPAGVAVTATMPNGTRQVLGTGSTAFGQAYAGSVSGWVSPQSGQAAVALTLAPSPARALAPQSRSASSAERATAPTAPRTPVPAGVTRPVPYGAERR